MTPSELAEETGRTVTTVCAYLRERFPEQAPGKGRRWELRAEHAAAVRERFRPRRPPSGSR